MGSLLSALNQCWRLLASFLPSPRASDDEDNIELDDAADADFGSPGAERRHGKRYKSKES